MKHPDLPSFLSGGTRAGLALASPAAGRLRDAQDRPRRRVAGGAHSVHGNQYTWTGEEDCGYRYLKERRALYRTRRR